MKIARNVPVFIPNSALFIWLYIAASTQGLNLQHTSSCIMFRMTYGRPALLTRCHFWSTHRESSSSVRKGSAILHLFQGVCGDWLGPEAQRLRSLFGPPDFGPLSRMGNSLPEELFRSFVFSLSLAAPDPHSQGRSTDLFHSWQRPSSPGTLLFSKAVPRWDSREWTFRLKPWCEF